MANSLGKSFQIGRYGLPSRSVDISKCVVIVFGAVPDDGRFDEPEVFLFEEDRLWVPTFAFVFARKNLDVARAVEFGLIGDHPRHGIGFSGRTTAITGRRAIGKSLGTIFQLSIIVSRRSGLP